MVKIGDGILAPQAARPSSYEQPLLMAYCMALSAIVARPRVPGVMALGIRLVVDALAALVALTRGALVVVIAGVARCLGLRLGLHGGCTVRGFS